MRRALSLAVQIVVALAFAVIAVRALAREFGGLSWSEVTASLGQITIGQGAAMMLATGIAYCAFATYDRFALRYFDRALSWRRSALSSTTAYAISNVLGVAAFTGNVVRYVLFARWGLGGRDVAIAALATMVVVNLALTLVAGFSLLVAPGLIVEVVGLDAAWAEATGALLLLVAGSLVAIAWFAPQRLPLGEASLGRHGLTLSLHLLVCVIDYIATAAVLYIILQDSIGVGLLAFVPVFSGAKLLGVMSNIPGGLGVFEAVMAVFLLDAHSANLAAALISYRVVFYLLPFAVAVLVLGVRGLKRDRRSLLPQGR
jgi:phosphatidylglycerol lysyltransferase